MKNKLESISEQLLADVVGSGKNRRRRKNKCKRRRRCCCCCRRRRKRHCGPFKPGNVTGGVWVE